MIVAVDATALTLLVNPGAEPPIDPDTNLPVTKAKERIEALVAEIERERGTVIVPTPALAEVLVRAGDAAPAILERLNKSARFRVADFDQRAAVEVASMTREAVRAGDKKSGSHAPWQKVKYDRQIIAIARVNNARVLYSDDGNVADFALQLGQTVIRTRELPEPQTEDDLFTLSGVSLDGELNEVRVGPAVDDFGEPLLGDTEPPPPDEAPKS